MLTVSGSNLELFPPHYEDTAWRFSFFGDGSAYRTRSTQAEPTESRKLGAGLNLTNLPENKL